MPLLSFCYLLCSDRSSGAKERLLSTIFFGCFLAICLLWLFPFWPLFTWFSISRQYFCQFVSHFYVDKNVEVFGKMHRNVSMIFSATTLMSFSSLRPSPSSVWHPCRQKMHSNGGSVPKMYLNLWHYEATAIFYSATLLTSQLYISDADMIWINICTVLGSILYPGMPFL